MVNNVIGFTASDAKILLENEGFKTSLTYYNYRCCNYYVKTYNYRVVRQRVEKNIVKLILAPQCALAWKGGGDSGS